MKTSEERLTEFGYKVVADTIDTIMYSKEVTGTKVMIEVDRNSYYVIHVEVYDTNVTPWFYMEFANELLSLVVELKTSEELLEKNGWVCVTYDKRNCLEYCKDIFGFGNVTIIFHKGNGVFFVKCDEYFVPAECFTNFKTEIEALIENAEVNL